MKSATDQLPVHPQPINKAAALHVAGGDKLGREELLWRQREQFARVITEVRIAQVVKEVDARRESTRAQAVVDKLPPDSNYTRDYRRRADRKRWRARGVKKFEKDLRKTLEKRLAP